MYRYRTKYKTLYKCLVYVLHHSAIECRFLVHKINSIHTAVHYYSMIVMTSYQL